MQSELKNLFDFELSEKEKPLFVFELANNHMGSMNHGLRVIRSFHKISRKFDFHFAFKFQFRDIPTFIHPDYRKRMDIKYVKRFSETNLSKKEWRTLRRELKKLGLIAICTPFDEKSVDRIEELNFDIIKIASCSFGDWPLLEKIVKTKKPIIASTAGAKLETIDRVVSFFQNRKKQFALMHCVGEYPTEEENLQLNQIDLLKKRYPGVVIGFSTHEDPNNFEAVKLAIAKGARILEKHVAVKTKKFGINAYSATPDQAKEWLKSAEDALKMNGIKGERAEFTTKELADLRQFKRGVFAKKRIKKGELIGLKDVFFAFPNQEKQILANDMSKYTHFYAKKTIEKNEAIIDVRQVHIREKIYTIVKRADKALRKYKIAIPQKLHFAISHHYGLDKFYQYGGILIDCVNREYCKKLIIMFSGQKHPVQYHKKKEETFYVLGGEFVISLNGRKKTYKAGDIVTVKRGVKHSMMAKTDGILEEVSSTHFVKDSFYEDEEIGKNKNRKTRLTYWLKRN